MSVLGVIKAGCSAGKRTQGKINEHIPHEKKNLEIIQNLSQESNTKIQKTVFKEQKARGIKRKTAEECGLE